VRGAGSRETGAMGSAGIRRRKRRLELHEPERITRGDVNRLFGRFRWEGLSPAGGLERFGFFSRQLQRNGTRGAWAFVAQAKWVWITIAVAIAVVTIVTRLIG
jgi:hypothetical protein